MSRPAPGAGKGRFARSAGTAALRGALLIAVAVAIGVLLLAATDDEAATVAPSADEAAQVDQPRPSTGSAPTTTPTTAAPAVPVARPPAEVRVLVANGSGVAGIATRFKDALAGVGYNALAPTNTTERPVPSVVYFAPGFAAEAEAVAATLAPVPPVEAMPAEPPVEQIGEAHVLLVVGPELATG